MAISAARIFHVNSNCRDIERSLAFYRDLLGFSASTHPLPDRPQPGGAFGLDEVLWDGWILQGDLGYGGLSLDLLEWKVPRPGGGPPRSFHEPGFHRLCFSVPHLDEILASGVAVLARGDGRAIIADPDGVPVEIEQGTDRRVEHVVINCRSLASVDYYRNVMGLQLVFVDERLQPAELAYGLPGALVRIARLKDPGSDFHVELHHIVSPPMPAVRQRAANDVGLFRMAWSTPDCAADEAVVRAAGSVPYAPTGELSVGDHLPLLLVLFWPGPDGECLELIEVPSASVPPPDRSSS